MMVTGEYQALPLRGETLCVHHPHLAPYQQGSLHTLRAGIQHSASMAWGASSMMTKSKSSALMTCTFDDTKIALKVG